MRWSRGLDFYTGCRITTGRRSQKPRDTRFFYQRWLVKAVCYGDDATVMMVHAKLHIVSHIYVTAFCFQIFDIESHINRVPKQRPLERFNQNILLHWLKISRTVETRNSCQTKRSRR